MTDQDLIAAFLAKKSVTRVAEGVNNGMTDRQWYRASTDNGIAKPTISREQASEQFVEQVREAALMGGVVAANEVMGY
jgi:hypothetical protein